MRIVIFGAGAMASLFAARLSSVAQVTVVDAWAEAIETIRARGIALEDSGTTLTARVEAELPGAGLTPSDLALVLVKSWQTAEIAPHLEPLLTPEGVAVTLQNGLGNLELLGPRAVAGSTEEGATLIAPGRVRAGGHGPTHVAAPEWVAGLLQSAGFDCRRCEPAEAGSLLWGKLAVSCGINALTALLRVTNGELLERPNAADLMTRAALECAAIARARGIELPYPDPVERVREVARKTAANRSSMLQDILRGARTECDAINGALAAEGRRLGIPTPINDFLWQLVTSAADINRSRSQECIQQKISQS